MLLAGQLLAQPVIITQPVNQTVFLGDNAAFGVMVTGVGPFTYQWRLKGTNLPNNIITSVAGNGTNAFSGDGGSATNASLNQPQGVAFDAAGNLLIADNNNDRVRKVDANGIITTVAGNGVGASSNGGSFSGDGGAATDAGLFRPNNLAFDASGNMYIADIFNNRVRKIDTNGIIVTAAGSFGPGSFGDNGPATSAALNLPASVALDVVGNLFIADLANSRVRKVDTNGIITTVAGKSGIGFSGDGGPATNAMLNSPQGVACDAIGNFYIADSYNRRIRKVDTNGIITTMAGGGGKFPGDNSAATNALLNSPWGLALDSVGNMYFADKDYCTIRKINTNGIITTVAGKPLMAGYSGDGGVATNASLNAPACVALDAAGNLFIADWNNNRIREVHLAGSPTITLSHVSITNAGNYAVVITSPSGSVTSGVVTLTLQLPPITPTFTSSNGLCTFTWGAIAQRKYHLQSTTNLATPNWIDLGSQITATSNSISTTNAVGPDEQRYYRVRLVP